MNPQTTQAKSGKIAILSDIHANWDALDAVLEDMSHRDPVAVFCLGDMVGYGPSPGECVDKMRDLADRVVAGNHEALLLGRDAEPVEAYQSHVAKPILLARKVLDGGQMEWLRGLGMQAEWNGVGFVHASFNEPEAFPYMDCPEEAAANFSVQLPVVAFHGHTHVPAVWEMFKDNLVCYHPPDKPARLRVGARYAINCGSVGQPRDGDPRASYAIYDPEARVLEIRRVEYDVRRAARRFADAGIPRFNATRLRLGR